MIKEVVILIIRFDEEDHRIPAPSFSLRSWEGDWVSSSDFYERSNLVVLFLHSLACRACRAFLNAVSERREEYEKENARLVAIFPEPVESPCAQNSALGEKIDYLSDPENLVRRNYQDLMAPGLVQPEEIMLFVLDNYGAPYVCLKGEEPEIPAQEDLLGWLRFIGIQCPE